MGQILTWEGTKIPISAVMQAPEDIAENLIKATPESETMRAAARWLREQAGFSPWVELPILVGALLLFAYVANWLARKVIVRLVKRVLANSPLSHETEPAGKLMTHLANVVPAFIIAQGITLIPELPNWSINMVQHVAWAFIIFTLARVLSDFLEMLNAGYERTPDAAARPIKGYIQVGKILIYGAAAVLIVASVTGQSPILLLSGLGAMAAVLLLVFKDTILSLVASIQLRSNDMLRVGDWIEMPQMGADGDVIDMALHVVRVQNFDKTVTTIPTHRLISDSFRNWRGMKDWGARRIKRSLFIDKSSIGFLSDADWQGLRRFKLLRPYMDQRETELAEWNALHAGGSDEDGGEVNKRRPTNVGTFRAYVVAYLKAHSMVSEKGTLLVRQLEPTDLGLPMEIYCFADTTVWREYEDIQSDIFDHLLAILPEFGLRTFQQPSGADVAGAENSGAGVA